MICPYCKEEGAKSQVTIGLGQSTTIAFSPYYDEEDRYHAHDPNRHSVRYDCSRGHAFVVEETRRCPSCDYGSEPTISRVK